jgi:thioredoxin-like negative regulator of GroEL
MKKDYALAAKQLHERNIGAHLATVDATAQPALQQRFEIRGFPTLRYFRRGQNVAAYERRRTADDLVDFMVHPPASKDEL